MRRFMLVPALGLALGLWAAVDGGAARTAPPVGADPNGDSQITPNLGEWMICVSSFGGEDAPYVARQLVNQIRNYNNLPAYVFNHGDEERKKQLAEFEAQEKLFHQFHPNAPYRRRTIHVEEQCAVLVGGYKDIDTAKRALEQIKRLKTPDLRDRLNRCALDAVKTVGPDGEEQKAWVNPFTTAFVTRNPSLPSQQANRYDDNLKKCNAYEEYSLLQCPRPWTLVVKDYVGQQVVQSGTTSSASFLNKLWPGANKPGQALDAAGLQAHELARVLRQLNFQSYVLHTKTDSLVTVGAFSGPNDPDIQRVCQQLTALQRSMTGGNARSDPLQLAVTPIPMEVPRAPGRGG